MAVSAQTASDGLDIGSIVPTSECPAAAGLDTGEWSIGEGIEQRLSNV